MEEDTLNKAELPEDTAVEASEENTDKESLYINNNLSEKSESSPNSKEDLIDQYKRSRTSESDTDSGNDASEIDQIRLAVENWGMQFANSHFDRPEINIYNSIPPTQLTEDTTINLLGEQDKDEFLKWCIKHYQEFSFSILLAVCILDRQPYQEIYQMATELQKILAESADEDDHSNLISKSHIIETLGLILYSDITRVRGVDLEVEFVCLPNHEQAEKYIQLLINEFSELKYMLTKYLTEKISKLYGNRHSYIVISGCIEALSYIGMADLQFFNNQILPRFIQKGNIGMDYCVSVLLEKLYSRRECRDFVKACTVQWGKLRNNPHNLLISLYVCSKLGKQETLVRDIWMNALNQLTEELITGNFLGKISHINMLQGLFKSGNRNISYYKGVIHAFHIQMLQAERNWEKEKLYLLNTVFLLFLYEDYSSCNVSEYHSRKRDMIWVGIFPKLDGVTGKELTDLWCRILSSKEHSKDSWKLLEDYLDEYQNYEDSDVDKLVFFFYHINRRLGHDQGIYFLRECTEKSEKPMSIVKRVYKKIKE